MNWQDRIYDDLLFENLTEGRRQHRERVDVEGRPLRKGSRPSSSTHTPLGGGVWKRTTTGEKTKYTKKGTVPVSSGSKVMKDVPAPIQGPLRAAVRVVKGKIKKVLGIGK